MARTMRLGRALVAASLVAGAALAAPSYAVDLDALKARAQSAADDVTALERRLVELRGEQTRLEDAVTVATQRIAALELVIGAAEARADEAEDRYEASAVDVYKAGSSTRLQVLLSARSLTELAALDRATGELARLDMAALEEFAGARARAERTQERVDARKQRLLSAQVEVTELAGEVASAIEVRSAALKELAAHVETLQAEARRAARLDAQTEVVSGGSMPVPDATGYGPGGPAQGIPVGFERTGITFEGIASWYGPGFEGNPTASGQIFDPDKFTVASKELPLGTWLHVEHEGRGVVVLVNDRGPYAEDRILDLSEAAAQAIGITGLGWVRAEILVKA